MIHGGAVSGGGSFVCSVGEETKGFCADSGVLRRWVCDGEVNTQKPLVEPYWRALRNKGADQRRSHPGLRFIKQIGHILVIFVCKKANPQIIHRGVINNATFYN